MRFVASVTTPATGVAAWGNLISLLTTDCGWTESYSAGSGLSTTNLSWSVLTSPRGSQICIQRGTTNLVYRVKYSRQAGFSGGSPSATRTPSATDEVLLAGGGTDASPTFYTHFPTDNTYSVRCSAMQDKYGSGLAGDAGFWMSVTITSGSATRGAFTYEPFQEGSFVECDSFASPTVGDADPMLLRWAAGSGGAASDGSPWQLNSTASLGWANATYANNSPNAWHKVGLTGAVFANWTGGAAIGNYANTDRAAGNLEPNPGNSKYQLADIPVYRTNFSGGAAVGTRVLKGLLAYSKLILSDGIAQFTALDYTAAVAMLKVTTTTSNVAAVAQPWPGGVAPANTGVAAEFPGIRSPADQDIPAVHSFSPPAATLLTSAQTVTVSVYYARENTQIVADYGTYKEVVYDNGAAGAGYGVVVTVVDDRETTYAITPTEWKEAALTLNVRAENVYNTATGSAAYTAPAPAPVIICVNRVRDSIASGFVFWTTFGADTTGTSYPGPGVFGVNTSDYCIASIYGTP